MKFAKSSNTIWSGVWMMVIPMVVMICWKKHSKSDQVNPVLSFLFRFLLTFLCWLIYAAGLVLLAGAWAASSENTTTILVVQISTMITCLGIMCLGDRLTPRSNKHKTCLRSMFPTLVVLTLVATATIVTSNYLGIGNMDTTPTLVINMMFVFVFFVMDIRFIVSGRYDAFKTDDSLLGSMKLSADFILIFGVLATLCE